MKKIDRNTLAQSNVAGGCCKCNTKVVQTPAPCPTPSSGSGSGGGGLG